MLLALEALHVKDSLEVRGPLQLALNERPEVAQFLHIPEGSVEKVAFGPDGQVAVGLGWSKSVVLFDARGNRTATVPLGDKSGSVKIWPSGRMVDSQWDMTVTPPAWNSSTLRGSRIWEVRMKGSVVRRVTRVRW